MNEQSVSTGYLAWQFSQAMGARLEKELRALDLTLAQHNALQHALREPGISSAAAARRAGITAQSMGAAINGLVDRGLMERRPHPTNRRVLCLHITDDGRRVAGQASVVIGRVNDDALTVLSPAERATAHSLLHRLVAHLNPDALSPSS
ncbi:MarR family winged helix-turn-helix transcriptional regulator [Streptomyces griseocarneus]|uniref:MarR family winged helix-turn-helix transcriptional regulator n=1 Tax=Streptomyces griseocarneus TaxID=51201 RepID=UPI00167EBB97|nr:MarR family transcriptional regulator [Streptomyces griseocarneus]MBZ6477160.1 MarR family transcriptional regulator [Streptomyces griseocarneus]